MARGGDTLEERQRRLKEAQQTLPAGQDLPARRADPAVLERHYTVAEIAMAWNVSPDLVRRQFETEPGVVALGRDVPTHKRRYVTLRIPASVLERVHRRLQRG